MPPRSRALLGIDSVGALLAGVLLAAFRAHVAELEAQPLVLLHFLLAANVTYGCYSGVLAVMSRRGLPRLPVDVLVVANLSWAGICWALAATTASTASALGTAHLVGEGLYVGLLGLAERRFVRPHCR